jgi:hypothetical protein
MTTPSTIVHEACHAVAAYLGGLQVAVMDAEHSRTWADLRDKGDAGIVTALAGAWGCRALDVDADGGRGDDRVAVEIARAESSSAEAAVGLLERCTDKTIALVASQRFRDLVMQLTIELFNDPRPLSGARANEMLRGWDPYLDGVHEIEPGIWAYYRRGLLMYSSNRRDQVERHEREGSRTMTCDVMERPHLT